MCCSVSQCATRIRKFYIDAHDHLLMHIMCFCEKERRIEKNCKEKILAVRSTDHACFNDTYMRVCIYRTVHWCKCLLIYSWCEKGNFEFQCNHRRRSLDLKYLQLPKCQQIFTGVPVTFEQVFTGIPIISNKVSWEYTGVPDLTAKPYNLEIKMF